MDAPNTNVTPEYGEFVSTCAAFGIRRSAAFTLANDGLLDTFSIGRKRFVYVESLRSLPQRLAKRDATK